MKPLFKHDCDCCTFLGNNTRNDMDLYYCPQSGSPTVIARYGDEGHEYMSGIVFKQHNPDIARAVELAEEKGLL
jgi:hypothetical protein